VTSGVDVREELFQFLIRLENAILRHVLDELDGRTPLRLTCSSMDSGRVSGDSPE